MDNNSNDTPYQITNQDDFYKELVAFLRKIREQISDASSKAINQVDSKPSVSTGAELSVLKYHEYKLKIVEEWFEKFEGEDWSSVKEDFQKVFKDAYDAILPKKAS